MENERELNNNIKDKPTLKTNLNEIKSIKSKNIEYSENNIKYEDEKKKIYIGKKRNKSISKTKNN